ncbi:hypothetical protein PG984_014239 [Apiospora sp. TS-2023a]
MQAPWPMSGGGEGDHFPDYQLMDPLSALGVASNILAVIDFGWTVLTEARSIHQSSSGLSGEAEFVDHLIQDVSKLDEGLPSLVGVSGELQTLLNESKSIIGLLQNGLQAVKAGNRSKWSSFLSALKQTWGKSQVKDLTSRLGKLQIQVTRHLQVATHKEITQGVTAISRSIAELESTIFKFDIKRRDDLQELQRNLIKAIDESARSGRDIANSINGLASDKNSSEHEQTKVFIKLADFKKLETATKKFSESAETIREGQEILERLHFDQLQTRHHAIEKAHSKTFKWAFEQQNQGLWFREWLENHNGIFWVYGKPGSGKSTFMKFLCGNEDTRNCLQRWAGEKGLIIAKFFFWNAGSNLQKSQEGLLRSLLFEILRQCPELMPAAKNAMAEIPDLDKPDPLRYTHNLMHIYQRIATQNVPLKFCFFVDGLDEFQEERRSHLDLIKFLKQLELSSDIKLCVSSRPWTVFVDEFGSKPEWTLKLEDLTRDDIQQYVSEKLKEHPQFNILAQMNTDYLRVVDAVVERAQGVFLWVYLAVRTLLQGLTYHDSVKTLYRRLQEFPPDLEPFFQHLIDSVDPIYSKQMTRYLKITTIANRPLLAMVYSYLDDIDDNPDFAIALEQSELSLEQIRFRMDKLRRRLDGRSRGLLEIVQWRGRGYMTRATFFEDRVDFIHRTVRDFLHQSEDVQSLLQQNAGSENIPLTACHAILATMKTIPTITPYEYDDATRFVYELFSFIRESLLENPNLETALEPIVEAAETSYRTTASTADDGYVRKLFAGLAARVDLISSVRKKLAANPSMLQNNPENHFMPVLHYALEFRFFKFPISMRTVTLLLEAGADPNGQEFKSEPHTVWSSFVEVLLEVGGFDKQRGYELIRVLLLHGADLRAPVYGPGEPPSAEQAIVELLTPDVANQLFQEIREIRSKAPWITRKQERVKLWYQRLVARLPR